MVENNPQLDKDAFEFRDDYGGFPYFTRKTTDNGILGRVEYLDEKHKIPGGCLAIGMMANKFFFMEEDFYAGQFTKRAVPRNFTLNSTRAQFFTSALNKQSEYFGSFSVRQFASAFENQTISLPTKDGAIDFEAIDGLIAKLENDQLEKITSYLTTNGLDDYHLTEKEVESLRKFSQLDWTEVPLSEFLHIKNTANILSRQIKPGSGRTPYLTAKSENNSTASFIEYDTKYLEEGNCIFIGGKTLVVTYQPEDFFSNDSHNLALYSSPHLRGRLAQLFLRTCIYTGLKDKYSWGNSISKAKTKEDYIWLPLKQGEFDLEFANNFMSAIQKSFITKVNDFISDHAEQDRELESPTV